MSDFPRFTDDLPQFFPRQALDDWWPGFFDAIGADGDLIEWSGPMFDVPDDDEDDDEMPLAGVAYLYRKEADGLRLVAQ